MKSLVAFEAVSRHLSLTRAGEELFISREAVSRQIKILEDYLGVKLFERLHRAVSLTTAGKEFKVVVQDSLENIARVSSKIQKSTQPFKITIATTVAISSFWLTPRLVSYRAQHPEAEIRVVVSDTPVDMLNDDIDIAFRYGSGHWPDVDATRLFDIESFPVCSPDYLLASAPIKTPMDLLEHTLINLDGEQHADENWQWWLKNHGVPVPDSFTTMGFDHYANVIQLAQDGQGIALGFSGVVEGLLNEQKLVRPINASLTTSLAVFLTKPHGVELPTQAQSFVDWILEDASSANSYAKSPTQPPLV